MRHEPALSTCAHAPLSHVLRSSCQATSQSVPLEATRGEAERPADVETAIPPGSRMVPVGPMRVP
jgi:hypothetical protein